MERTECFGFCPVFRVEIFEPADVVFHGDENVRAKGRHTGQLRDTSASELVAAFVSAGFFELREQYTGVNDAPATILTAKDRGKAKTVVFQRDAEGLPSVLPHLEARVARAVELERWVGSE
jgi:hypothetical protein